MGEEQAAGGGHGDGFDGAGFPASVPALASAVTDRNLCPGQVFQLGEQGRLVSFRGDEQVGAAGGDLVGVAGLGVHGVGDEYHAVQAAQHGFDGVEQWCERRDFVAFRRDGDLRQDDAGTGVQCGQEMDFGAVGAAGAAHCLAVHGDDDAVPSWPGRGRWPDPGV